MLDSHPSVWGLGEDSIFNGNLPAFRDEVVRGATQFPGDTDVVQATVMKHSKYVVKEMKSLSAIHIEKNKTTKRDKTVKKKVEKITDKMLFNFRNIGKETRARHLLRRVSCSDIAAISFLNYLTSWCTQYCDEI